MKCSASWLVISISDPRVEGARTGYDRRDIPRRFRRDRRSTRLGRRQHSRLALGADRPGDNGPGDGRRPLAAGLADESTAALAQINHRRRPPRPRRAQGLARGHSACRRSVMAHAFPAQRIQLSMSCAAVVRSEPEALRFKCDAGSAATQHRDQVCARGGWGSEAGGSASGDRSGVCGAFRGGRSGIYGHLSESSTDQFCVNFVQSILGGIVWK